ncbi:Uma2 family endonuclease [Streptomyces glaucosporus]|uniref:Uma2 family endonuclease n=1 Tax=Streptomyces glaucosporus TaxID=284044 RepID=A0ABN3HTU7_9ACTN
MTMAIDRSVQTSDSAQMSVEEFEQLEASAPETVTLEFVRGELRVKPVPDGDHGEIIRWLLKRCMVQRPESYLYPEQGLIVEKYGNGRARPDGALAPEMYFAGRGEWSDPSGVLMVVEVTSTRPGKDRTEKPDGYAEAGIPVHLLVDRERQELVVRSRPEKGRYRDVHTTTGLGEELRLPDPVGIVLATEELKELMA